MKKTVIIALCLAAFAALTLMGAEENKPAKQMLQSGEVQKFINTLPKLQADLKRYNVKYDAKQGSFNFGDALAANQEFLSILKKHGWDETFFAKAGVILLGYSIVMYRQNLNNTDSEMAKSLKEIQNNPDLSAELKKQLIEQLTQAQKAMKQVDEQWNTSIHPADLAMVTPKVQELKKILEAN